MRDLLLVSTSTVHGTPYLEHCAAQARELFAGCRRVGFAPFALFDRGSYAANVAAHFGEWGFEIASLHAAADPAALVEEIDGLFINAGHFRNGIVLGPASARLLADLVLGRPPVVDPAPYGWTAARG